MQGSFIRDLSFKYIDPIQQVIEQTTLPRKFLDSKLLFKDTDYRKNPKIVIPYHSKHVQKKSNQIYEESFCAKLFSCLNLQLCTDCKKNLCGDCRNSKFLKLTICDNCKGQLCPQCRRKLQGKKTKLRSYRINLKNMRQLHFQDCQCQDCMKLNKPR